MARAKKGNSKTRPQILSAADKAEIISLRKSLRELQNVEILHHRIECPDCAKRFRDASNTAGIRTLIIERIEQLNRSAA